MIDDKCTLPKEDIILNLQKGLHVEHSALGLCNELLNFIENKEDKKKIASIAKDEERHIKIVEDLIAITETYYIGC